LARPLDLIFIGVSAAFAPLVFAAFEKDGVEAARKSAGDAFALLAAFALPACVGLALIADPLAALMIGDGVRTEAAHILPWLALAGLFSGFTLYYWSEAFQLAQRTGLRALLMLAPGAVQISATFVLTPAYGALGAAMAAACGAVIGCCLLAVVGRGLIALPVNIGALMRALIATAFMAAGLMALPPNAGLAAEFTVGAALYAGAALALNLLGARTRLSAVFQTVGAKLRRSNPIHGLK